jgi:hypothetical protein
MSDPPTIFDFARRRPRIFGLVSEGALAWLEDKAWVMRKQRGEGTDDGTPIFTDVEYGPYPAKLWEGQAQERFVGDRTVLEITRSMALACPFRPVERDTIRVAERDGTTRLFRVEGTVNNRASAWGETPVWNVELTDEEDY